MKFLYSTNNGGILSSLTGSWLFWLTMILIVLLVLVVILNSNANLQKKLHVEKMFGNVTASNDEDLDSIRQSLINEINNGNNGHLDELNNGVVPDLKKHLDADLDDEIEKNALLFGYSETDKNINHVYSVAKKEGIFKVADETLESVNFKIELKDLTKITTPVTEISEMKIYNQNRKCIAIFTFDIKKIKIKSISPFFDDVTLNLDDTTRLLVFMQKSNKLFIDVKQVAAFNIYDKITYFHIKSPIIKELQYM